MINLKNKLWILLVLIIIVGIGVGIYFFTKNNNKTQKNYIASKSSVNEQNYTENNSNSNISIQNNVNETNTIQIAQNATGDEQKKEEEIASFSTKIFTKDSSRQNNISITCNTLNGTIVSNGSTFSFCDSVGQATSSKGYQEADIFDKDGNKKKGLGGGNCQVSTTLYNAVLKVTNLVVTERHEHSNKVPYIQTGKDAAVAYGSYDLKFRNDTGYDVKIKAENTADNVIITLYRMHI